MEPFKFQKAAACFFLAASLTFIHYKSIAQVNIAFTATPPSGCAPLGVTFTNTSNAGSNYTWNFGDGSPIDTNVSTSHTFTSTGTFTVTLYAYNTTWNFLGSATNTILVACDTTSGSFNMSSNSLCPGEILVVNYGADALSFQWDFGDSSALSYDQWAYHTYSDSGVYNVTLIVETINGTDTIVQSVTVSSNAIPNSGFQISSNPGCTGDDIIFEPFNYYANSYLWDFGDSTTSNYSYNYHSYSTDSIYIVSLTVTNICGNSSASSDTLIISSSSVPPVPVFSVSAHTACPGVFIDFYYWYPAATYLWDFGDSTTDSASYAYHSYTNPGDYQVTLTITNGCGNSNSYSDSIIISSNAIPPVPYFTSSLQSACPGQLISFDTWVAADSYLWDFGDSTTDNQPYTYHSYTVSGNYTVTLTITNSCGNTNSYSKTIVVNTSVTPPTPYFSFSPTVACPGDEIQFYSWVEADSFLWDFGDGIISTDYYFTLHTYADTGIYTVSLTITNTCANTSSYSQNVTVTNSTNPPVPYFYPSLSEACPGDVIDFYTFESATSYLWDFGDGTTDSVPYVSHSYDTLGNYTVSLTITNMCGNSNSYSQNIFISDTLVPPVPYFSFYPDSVCPGDSIQFYSWDTGALLWDFGDGTTDIAPYLNHAYDTSGIYTVTLTVTNSCGNANSYSQTVSVSGTITPPVPYFSASPNPACPGEVIQFYSWDIAPSYLWDFGDGTTDTMPYTSHVYSDTGNFLVTLTITNACGNSNSYSEIILMSDTITPPVPYFSFYPDSVCPGDSIQFSSWDTGTLLWDFGDGTTDTAPYLNHAYDTSGIYAVTLTVTNSCGNANSYSQTVSVSGTITPPEPYFSASPNPACPGEVIQFYSWDIAATYSWDFGDGNNDSGQVVSHSYSTFGNFSVTLTNTNGCGYSNSYTDIIYIDSTAVPNFYVDANTYNLCTGDSFVFYTDYDAVTYHWDFGDSTTSDSVFIWNSMYAIWHAYTAAGSYTVALTATNTCGNSATNYVYVNVVDTGLPVDGGFYWVPPDSLTYAPCDTIQFYGWGGLNYSWDFGDGSVGSSSSPVHSYDSAGIYIVSVTIFNGCGDSKTYTDSIEILGTCSPVTGTENIFGETKQLLIYPNPTTGKIQVIGNQYSVIGIEIYNLLGEKIFSLPLGKGWDGLLDLSNQPASIYFLQIKTEREAISKKLIIQKL